MGSKNRISYRWRLFVPLVAAIWIIVAGVTYWSYTTERAARKNQINEQLAIISNYIVHAYEHRVDSTMSFMDFAVDYYHKNTLYGDLRITAFLDNEMVRVYGQPIGLMNSGRAEAIDPNDLENMPGIFPDELYAYNFRISNDGRFALYTLLPRGVDMKDDYIYTYPIFWLMLAIAVGSTILAFISTRFIGRNINILRNVADRAVNDPNFIPPQDYPHDELGDISRQIVSMYNERTQAMQRQRREHEVAMHAIEEKARAKRQLTNNINHELRTPIGVIKGYLDTIVDNPDMDSASRTRFLSKAQEHVNRLVNLIADVSAITRLEEGGELISTEELDFHDIAFAIASDLEESGLLGEMKFRYDVPLDCKIMGNSNLLTGMLINLAKNAGAYAKGTYCELVCTGQDDKFYHFEFRDDGRGVPEEHLPHLFERFYRVDAGRARKGGSGTGLGLPIVQNTILAHGGTIEVSNRPEGGLCFTFTLTKAPSR